MPRYTRRARRRSTRRKTHRSRRASRRFGSRRASRRFGSSRRGRLLQSGGGHKEDIVELITDLGNFPDIYTFFQGMDQPVWHHDFPKKDQDEYILIIQEGEATNVEPQKLIVIKLKKLADHFAEVNVETLENKKAKDFVDQYPMETLTTGAEYEGIRDASKEIFDLSN